MKPCGRKKTGESLFLCYLIFTNRFNICLFQQVFLKIEEQIVEMTAIESKEEISDTDSGIILHSGKNITMKSASDFHVSCIT